MDKIYGDKYKLVTPVCELRDEERLDDHGRYTFGGALSNGEVWVTITYRFMIEDDSDGGRSRLAISAI